MVVRYCCVVGGAHSFHPSAVASIALFPYRKKKKNERTNVGLPELECYSCIRLDEHSSPLLFLSRRITKVSVGVGRGFHPYFSIQKRPVNFLRQMSAHLVITSPTPKKKKPRDPNGLLLLFSTRHLTLFFFHRSVSFVVFDSECRPTVNSPFLLQTDGNIKDPLGLYQQPNYHDSKLLPLNQSRVERLGRRGGIGRRMEEKTRSDRDGIAAASGKCWVV